MPETSTQSSDSQEDKDEEIKEEPEKEDDGLRIIKERYQELIDVMESQDKALKKLEQEKYELIQSLIRSQDLNIELREKNLELVKELEHIKSPPKIMGEVVEKIPTGEVMVKNGTGQTFIVNVSSDIELENLDIGTRVSLDRNNLSILGLYDTFKDPIVCAAEIIEKPITTYDDVGGLDEQLQEVREAVELPLTRQDLFKAVGIVPPKGILLSGPPGTGKTLIAKAVAHHTNATFIRMVASELVQKFIGEGGRLVRELFQLARERTPCIIFIDELDAIGAKRLGMDTTGDREVQRTLMQLLAEMDGFDPLQDISIVAATNRLDIIDEALLRPGRFDRIVEVTNPDKEGILKILQIHTRPLNMEKKVDLEGIADRLGDVTGADIAALCMEAGMMAIRDKKKKIRPKDFEAALKKVKREEDGTRHKGMFA
jgi:proteasome regulatory subunit